MPLSTLVHALPDAARCRPACQRDTADGYFTPATEHPRAARGDLRALRRPERGR